MTQPEALDREGADLELTVRAVAITDPETYDRATDMLRSVKRYLARVAEVFDPIVLAAHNAHKEALAQRRKVEQHALEAERVLKVAIASYQDEQARRRRDAEAAARQERERLEAEERARVLLEQARLQTEAEAQQLADALAAEAEGDRERADRIVAAPVVVPPVAPRPVFVAPAPVLSASRADGVSIRQAWDFVVEDAARIPAQYLVPDLVAIRKVVQALGDRASIPGIRVFAKSVVAAKAGP